MTVSFTQRIKNSLVATSLVVVGLMAVAPAAHADEIKSAMKSMKSAYRAAMSSSTIEEFAQYAARLQSGADTARGQTFGDNPSVYREGMQQLQQDINSMNQAIRNNDLSGAKSALERIRSTEKRYHSALDV